MPDNGGIYSILTASTEAGELLQVLLGSVRRERLNYGLDVFRDIVDTIWGNHIAGLAQQLVIHVKTKLIHTLLLFDGIRYESGAPPRNLGAIIHSVV